MAQDNRQALLKEFLERFPLESLKDMSLETYSNNNASDSFCYWVEFKTRPLGGIQGATSYKFGIYACKGAPKEKNGQYANDGQYAWQTRYGSTRDEAFENVRETICKVAQYANDGRFDEIEEINLSNMFKWKIAFLYSKAGLIPIYAIDMLRDIVADAYNEDVKDLKYYDLQKVLLSHKGEQELYAFYDNLLSRYQPKTVASETDDEGVRYWLYAPGENARMWDEFYAESVMGLGWSELGDYSQYDNESLVDVLEETYGGGGSHKNDKTAILDFLNRVKIGDVIIVKKGRRTLLGRGIVKSDYYYDDSKKVYGSRRKVEWTNKGVWPVDHDLVIKTLTDISQYDGYPEKLEGIINGLPAPVTDERKPSGFWFLNANPKIWSMTSWVTGTEQAYTLVNENGNKRRIYQNFLNAKQGDKLICYESSPTKQIVALGIISKSAIDNQIYFKKTETLLSPIDYSTLKDIPELAGMEYFINPNGSLFKLTEVEYEAIMDLVRETNPASQNEEFDKYTDSDFLKDVYMSSDKLHSMKSLLERKKNIILQGAPGVGKTYCAKRLCYCMMEKKDNSKIAFVQFHQNYSYEDFIMGYRPEGQNFELRKGIFYNFCKKAQNDPDNEYFFIIDEINRGNLSKIFGELLMLIENDYRNDSVTLAYNGESFSVPANLYLIGMMNTADRSLAMIDYALRRRFSFVEIEPCYCNDGFKQFVDGLGSVTAKKVVDVVVQLNETIRKDDSLGKGFEIGHSYFCGLTKHNCDDSLLKGIVQYDIIPTISEYWFDDLARVEEWSNKLLGVF